QKRKGQVVLRLKCLMRGGRVRTDAEHDGVALLDLGVGIAEATGLQRAARGVVHGIKVDDDTFATQVREPDDVALLIGQGEVWRQVPDLQCTAVVHDPLISLRQDTPNQPPALIYNGAWTKLQVLARRHRQRGDDGLEDKASILAA